MLPYNVIIGNEVDKNVDETIAAELYVPGIYWSEILLDQQDTLQIVRERLSTERSPNDYC